MARAYRGFIGPKLQLNRAASPLAELSEGGTNLYIQEGAPEAVAAATRRVQNRSRGGRGHCDLIDATRELSKHTDSAW